MKFLVYLALMIPLAAMIAVGALICAAKRNEVMSRHHFAKNYDLRTYSVKTMSLFTSLGVIFFISGVLILKEHLYIGIAAVGVGLVAFIILFSLIQKKR